MTRVVHVILSVDDAAGGPATLLADVLPLADRLGHESVVLAVQTAPSRVADAMRRHARVVTTGRGRFLGRAHTHARMFLDVWREARAADVLVAHSFFNLPGVVTALVAGVRRRPLVIAPHGCLDPYDVRKHRRAKAVLAPLWRLVLQRATVWCITDREARELVTFGARPHCMVVAPPVVVPGPTVEATAQALLERAVPEALAAARRGGVVVSFVGRFAEKKGLPRLLDAFESVARDDDVLVLAGASDAAYDGLRFDLDRTLAANSRRTQVARPGWIDAETRSALWTLPSVFVLPSDDENFGMAVAEAMAGGVPVVVSDRVALADLVADTDSGVVTSTDPAEVGAALRALLADPERRQATGRRARRAVEDHFSPDAVTRAYAGLVHTAVTR